MSVVVDVEQLVSARVIEVIRKIRCTASFDKEIGAVSISVRIGLYTPRRQSANRLVLVDPIIRFVVTESDGCTIRSADGVRSGRIVRNRYARTVRVPRGVSQPTSVIVGQRLDLSGWIRVLRQMSGDIVLLRFCVPCAGRISGIMHSGQTTKSVIVIPKVKI